MFASLKRERSVTDSPMFSLKVLFWPCMFCLALWGLKNLASRHARVERRCHFKKKSSRGKHTAQCFFFGFRYNDDFFRIDMRIQETHCSLPQAENFEVSKGILSIFIQFLWYFGVLIRRKSCNIVHFPRISMIFLSLYRSPKMI